MDLLTRRKAAEKLGVSISTIDKWSKKKILKPLRADDQTRTIRFSKTEVEKLFKNKN